MRRRDFVGMGAAAAAALLARSAFAQQTIAVYPSRAIHLIVPSSAGGVHDVIARIWADRVKSSLGSIVVENRSGGGASIAINAVAQSQPDGHTFLLGSTSNLVLREGLGNRVYDAARDLVAASIFATTSTSITVGPSVPVGSVNERIAYNKANPGKLSYGSGGTGAITPHHRRDVQAAGGRPRHRPHPLQGLFCCLGRSIPVHNCPTSYLAWLVSGA